MYYAKQLDACRQPKRVAKSLLKIRKQFVEEDVPTKSDDKLLLATWNIREFDSPAYGDRLPESFLYIAEIISRFDLVAIQEVRRDLAALDKLKAIRSTPLPRASG